MYGNACYYVINNLLVDNTNFLKVKDIYLLILGIVVFSSVFAITLKNFFVEKAKSENLHIQKRSLEMQKEDYDNRVKMNQDIQKMKHDIKNNLISIEYLVREKKYDEVEKYLNKLSGMPVLKKVIDSGNPVIDGLLNVNIRSYTDINFHIQLISCYMLLTLIIQFVNCINRNLSKRKYLKLLIYGIIFNYANR